ncbi:MAG TPA: arginine--tRNA ligase [Acidobacteriaceae bacterium]|nr:arginine--tRNA ligase [Acidobacteriaceae bacterium]
MYRTYRQQLFAHIDAILRDKFQLELPRLTVEEPPQVAMGDYALPLAFELARTLRKAPRKIAEELLAAIGAVPGFAGFEVAGAGYINCRLDRAAAARKLAETAEKLNADSRLVLVEHTSINPNKAAHIGHLRNAILGDTLVRMLRAADSNVGVQNYIDNTGVQVADVVVALVHLQSMDMKAVERWMQKLSARDERIDYACWDLYAQVSQWYGAEEAQKEARKQIRLDTLHALEAGSNETAAIADLVSTAVLRRHLETMLRLGIEYDFLPRESEILHLHFWEAAFALLKQSGVLYQETQGKNAGCWVMRRGTGNLNTTENRNTTEHSDTTSGNPNSTVGGENLNTQGEHLDANPSNGPDEDAKVIVRSNGTVTYVGKDIAYHLWKFNKLGLDFGYRPFSAYPDNRECWISTTNGIEPHPSFGHADAIYNVIDSRQSDPQNNVIEALRGMGFNQAADNYHHFSYEMVALTPRCAMELGYAISEEDQSRAYIEVSGRKGFGVKADDLIDKLIEAAVVQVNARQPERSEAERREIATKIAVGALRYYMLRYTRNTVIAFDFQDALSFEGETGPYVQYAVVRAANIFRKGGISPEDALREFAKIDAARYFAGEDGDSLWELWLLASKSAHMLERSIQTTEPAYLAKYAFQLAQQFSNFYHRHHILTESDPARKTLLLATAAVTQRELVRTLGWMGIDVPDVM